MNAIILPYKNGSRSSSALANALGIRQIRLAGSTIHRQRPKKLIIWGNSGRNLPPQGLGAQHTVINSLTAVAAASNKLDTFNILSETDVRIPEYTTEDEVAQSWVSEGHKVVERHQLTGHSGAGIRISERFEDMQGAPLYVKYIKKQDEYRVHIIGGQVIDVQRKARRSDVPDEDVNWQVRNHQNGFCYMRENVNPDSDVIQQALNAILALGLHFGAVDVIWNAHQRKAYVLEVNTACGLEGTTLERYTTAFQELLSTGEVTPLVGYDFSEETSDLEGFSEDVATDEAFEAAVSEMQQTIDEILLEEPPAPEPVAPAPLSFQEGDLVRIAESSRYYRDDLRSNPRDVSGNITSLNPTLGGHYIRVSWTNGQTNVYRPSDLVHVQESAPAPQPLTMDTLRVGMRLRALQSGFYSTDLSVGQVVEVVETLGSGFYARTEDDSCFVFREIHLNGEYFELVDETIVQQEQSTTSPEQPRLNKWLVSVDGSVNLEEGVFDTQEDAEMALTSPDFHNLRQLGHSVRVVQL